MENPISHDIDRWIEKLSDCKPLTEAEVKQLCDQVIDLTLHKQMQILMAYYNYLDKRNTSE